MSEFTKKNQTKKRGLKIMSFKKMRNIIVVVTPDAVEVWGNLIKLCKEKGLPYHSLKSKKFPISHDGMMIYKKPLN